MATAIEYGMVVALVAVVVVTGVTTLSPKDKKALAASASAAKPIPKPIPNLDPVLAGKFLTYLNDKCRLSSVIVYASKTENMSTSRGYACKSFVTSVVNAPEQYAEVYIDNPKWAAQELGMERTPVALFAPAQGSPNFTIRSIQYGK